MAVSDSKLPKICPVLLLNKPECKRYLEALNKEFAPIGMEGLWNTMTLCRGEFSDSLRGSEPRYLSCPGFSRWFWEEAVHQVGAGLKR